MNIPSLSPLAAVRRLHEKKNLYMLKANTDQVNTI